MNLLKSILNSLELFFGLYSFLYLSIYSILLYLSVKATIKHFREKKELNEKVLTLTDESTGVSIIAPAFNEEQTIIESVKSFFSQIYSKYEVVIINDGSTDNTLGLLIDEFDLVKVDFYYIEKIPTQPVRGHYKSTNPLYSKLLVVDKENKVEVRPVQLGRQFQQEYEVVEGLKADEQVIVSGIQHVRAGMTVNAHPVASQTVN